jgi:pyruvate/2-oxoglutarate dehydrogenase complex dihydrolipoamide dehydrogenase (E3) component
LAIRGRLKDVSRVVEKGETKGFMKVLVDRETKQILGASLLGSAGDEVIHCIINVMYAKAPYTLHATGDAHPSDGLRVRSDHDG